MTTKTTKAAFSPFLATMTSESFNFYALGKTEAEAKRAIAKKFNERATEQMTLAELEDWYGIWCFPVEMGEAIRI